MRRRAIALLAITVVVLLGLASRRWPVAPDLLGKYPGDALWALMVLFGWTVLLPWASTGRIALLAGVTCLAIECLKLWQAPWLVEIRNSIVGHLVFGQIFSWQNLVAYAVGIAVGVVCHRWLFSRKRAPA